MDQYVDKSQLGKQEGITLVTQDSEGQEVRTALPESEED